MLSPGGTKGKEPGGAKGKGTGGAKRKGTGGAKRRGAGRAGAAGINGKAGSRVLKTGRKGAGMKANAESGVKKRDSREDGAENETVRGCQPFRYLSFFLRSGWKA